MGNSLGQARDPARASTLDGVGREESTELDARLHLASQAAGIVAWELDVATGTLRYSDNLEAHVGNPDPNPFLSLEAFTQQVHPEDREQAVRAFDATLQSGLPFDAEYRVRFPDGSWHWLHSKGNRVTRDGGALQVLGISEDITTRKNLERALRESELARELAMEAAGMCTWDQDLVTGEVKWSTGHYALWGCKPGQCPGTIEGFNARVHPEDLANLWEVGEQAKQSRTPFQHEFRVVWPDDSVHWIASRGRYLFDPGGRAIRLLGVAFEITDRKQAEEALRQNETQLRHAQSVAHVGSWHLDLTQDRLTWSEETCRIFARRRPPLTYADFLECVHPDDRTGLDRAWQATLAGAPYNLQHRILAGGETRWVHQRAALEYDSQGRAVGCLGTVQDITERKQIEEQLQRQEEQYRALVETTFDWVWELDANGRYVYASPRVKELLGYTPEEVLGRTPFDLMPDGEAERIGAIFADLAAKRESFAAIENLNRHRQGHLVVLETSGVPIFGPNGEYRGYRGMDRDITERKRMENELRQLNQELERRVIERTSELSREVAERERREVELRKLWSAVDQSPAVVMMTDRDGVIEYVNPQFEKQTGYTAAEVLGRKPRLLRSGVHDRSFYEALWQTLRAGKTWRGELCNRRKDGSQFWELGAIAPILDATGRAAHFVAYKEDITERRHVAEELVRAKEAADAANRTKSVFLANMSHEIRTPMNAILGFSQLLLRDSQTTPGQRQHLAAVMRNGEHLLAIIEDLLEMARIEAGRLTLHPGTFDLELMLADLERLFGPRARARNVRLRVEQVTTLPAAVVADQTKLRQILSNLLANAVKFTAADGSITLRVSAQPELAGGWRLRAEVEDTGIGIAAHELEGIFRAFHQTEAGRRLPGGTGLGLAISREFARLMGGELTVVSAPGVGSTFRLEVRVGTPAPGATPPASRPSPRGRHLAADQTCRVLVVDDEADNRELLARLLIPVGFQVGSAHDGEQALTQCETWHPHVVLLDLRMPGMDGYEFLARLRASRGPAIKVIALSATVFEPDKQRALESGADRFLTKPFHDVELFDSIAQLAGVTYVQDDGSPVSADTDGTHPERPGTPLSPLALTAVPPELVRALGEATSRADYDDMHELIAQVASHDAAVGRQLRRCLEGYDYESLQLLLASGAPNAPAVPRPPSSSGAS